MTKVLISTVGARDYTPTEYRFEDGQVVRAEHFVEALTQYLQPDQVIALLTQDARILQWEAKRLKDRLLEIPNVQISDVDIPNAATEQQSWELFEIVAKSLPHDAQVTIDITHGFRHLPTLLLSAVNYLRHSSNIVIQDIYYGAFEAVERNVPQKPVLQIGAFADVMKWSSAVESYNRTGDMLPLAKMLRETQNALRKRPNASQKLPTRLKSVARVLEELATALDLVRPTEVFDFAGQLQRELRDAEAEFPQWAKPFNLLLEKLYSDLSPLALENKQDIAQFIRNHWLLIEWYNSHERLYAAALLLREWIVSQQVRKNGGDLFEHSHRKAAEDALNDRNAPRDTSDEALIAQTWLELTEIRNDLAHCGMRQSPKPAKSLGKLVKEKVEKLRRIAQER